MVKKKQRKKVLKMPVPKLDKIFSCPECGRKKVVDVRFIKKDKKAFLRCHACGEEYETELKRAMAPIDVFYKWIDEKDKEREKEDENQNKDEENDEQENYDNENENEEADEDEGNEDNSNSKNNNKHDKNNEDE